MSIDELARGRANPWAASNASSTVVYPNCVFALERHGVFPFERFAYNALHLGTEVLFTASLPETLEVALDGMTGRAPWSLGAQIRQSTTGSGEIHGYRLETSPFTPPVLLLLVARLRRDDLVRELGYPVDGTVGRLHAALSDLSAGLSAAVRATRTVGLGEGLRILRDASAVSADEIQAAVDDYDAVAKFLVNHEWAHAYIQRYDWICEEGPLDRRALELLADLVGVAWLFAHFVVKTPDLPGYRQRRGVGDHAEAIRANAEAVFTAHCYMLVFMAVASAVEGEGFASLAGGLSHPHAFIRHMLWDSHFGTLVVSHYSQCFSPAEADSLGAGARQTALTLAEAGVIPPEDIAVIFENGWREECRRAAELAATQDLPELRAVRTMLGWIEDMELPSSP